MKYGASARCGCVLVVVGVSWLLLAGTAGAVQTERVANGGFESGTAQWSFTNANHCTLGTCARAPANGVGFASSSVGFEMILAMTPNQPLGSITQSVLVPEAPASLTFNLRFVDSMDPTIVSSLDVSLDGTLLTSQSPAPGAFQLVTVPIPAGLIGGASPRLLEFEGFCNSSSSSTSSCDSIDLDDVSLLTGTPVAPGGGTGVAPVGTSVPVETGQRAAALAKCKKKKSKTARKRCKKKANRLPR